MSIRIVVDTGVDLNKELMESDIVSRVPFFLEIEDEVFVDDNSLNKELYLEKMEGSKKAPKSAAPSPHSYLEALKLSDKNFILTISGKLSGSYNSAMAAKNNLLSEYKDHIVHIVDSKTACAGETLIALKLKELIEANVPFEEITEKITGFVDNVKTIFILESFENLVKSGRMNAAIAKIAQLLSIVPICKADDGEIALLEKVRGYKSAFNRLVKIVAEDNVDFTEKILSITHVKCEERAVKLKEEILKVANFKAVVIQEASGLCSNYAERGGIVISY